MLGRKALEHRYTAGGLRAHGDPTVWTVLGGPAHVYYRRVPTVFMKDGFRFFFYSNEHEPMHVHVRKAGGEAVFEIEAGVELRESAGLKLQELRQAQDLAEQHRQLIIEKWHEHID